MSGEGSLSPVSTFVREPTASATLLEEGNHRRKPSLPPLESDASANSKGKRKSGDSNNPTGPKWFPLEVQTLVPQSDAEGAAISPLSRDSALTAAKGSPAEDVEGGRNDGGESVDRAEGSETVEEDKDSAQRIFIGWLQARQRECLILISLICVIISIVDGVTVVTTIPVVTLALLARDNYWKWENRKTVNGMKGLFSSTKRGAGGGINGGTEKRPLLAETCSGSGMITPGAKDGKSYGNKNNVSKREGDMGAGAVKKGGQNNKPNGKGEDGERALKDGADQQHQPRAESNRRSNWWVSSNDPSNNSSAGDTSNQEGGLHQNVNHEDSANGGDDDSCSTGTGGQGDQDDSLSFLETPFQMSVRLVDSAIERVQNTKIRRQLKRVAQILSDPDSLHIIKDGSNRRSASDMGTRSYIESVLQTPAKGSSADCNWRKLRAGMFVVRSMGKDFCSTEGDPPDIRSERSNSATDDGIGNHRSDTGGNKSDLDDLLDYIAGEIKGVGAPGDVSRSQSRLGAEVKNTKDAESAAAFCRLNRALIQGQQLVAKTLSRGEMRKDLDRLTMRELLDVIPPSTMPENILESHEGEDEEQGDGVADEISLADMRTIPRLPFLDEGRMEDVAAMMSEGRFLKWNFDVFALEERSDGHSLWFTAITAFSYHNLIGAFGMSFDRLSHLFMAVEATYCYNPEDPNSYHTHVHAADVTLSVAHFLSVDAIAKKVRTTHGVALLLAAIMHDYRHPGVNNGYLVRDLDPLAVTYNDASVLENFHAAEGFKMMMDPKFDIFKGWKSEEVKFFRHAYVKCILATDLALSLEYISKFQSLTNTMSAREAGHNSNNGHRLSATGGLKAAGETLQSQTLLLQMVLKVADVAHPCKPWEIHRRWSDLVTMEFFKQGDKELSQGLAISPLCDRRDQNLAKSQCDFIDFIVRPCVTIFSVYCKVSIWNDQLDTNFKTWKTLYQEQGGALRASSPPGSRRRSLR